MMSEDPIVDTATEACSAALLVGDKVFSRWRRRRGSHLQDPAPWFRLC